MLIEPRVFARQQRIDEQRRHFIKRYSKPIRSGQAAVDFPVEVENGVPFRHLPHLFHVERGGPAGVK